jgi:hypothetical protein
MRISSSFQTSTLLTGKEKAMDFAIILIVSNTVLAGFIYFIVTRIWQD